MVDPTAAYEKKPDPTVANKNKLDWIPTVKASAGLTLDLLVQSSDAFTPLKSVASCLSTVLKYYDVRHPFSRTFLCALLTFELANGGEP